MIKSWYAYLTTPEDVYEFTYDEDHVIHYASGPVIKFGNLDELFKYIDDSPMDLGWYVTFYDKEHGRDY